MSTTHHTGTRPRPHLAPTTPGRGHRDDVRALDRAVCTCCDRRRAEPAWLTCRPCLNRLRDNLHDLIRLTPRLDPRPGSNPTGASRGAPGFTSRPAARLDVLTLTDTRRHVHDSDKPRNASGVWPLLRFWHDRALDAGLNVAAAHTGYAAGRALLAVLDDLGRTWWVDEFAAAVDSAAHHVRAACGELDVVVPIGRCPELPPAAAPAYLAAVDDLTPVLAEQVRLHLACRGEVRAPAFGRTARCSRCKAWWAGPAELRDLSARFGDALLGLPELSRYLGTTTSTLTTWAQRDGWTKYVGAAGRRRYRLAEARASWWASWDRRHPEHGCAPPPGWWRDEHGWTDQPPAAELLAA